MFIARCLVKVSGREIRGNVELIDCTQYGLPRSVTKRRRGEIGSPASESQVLIFKELHYANTVAYFRTDVNNPLARFVWDDLFNHCGLRKPLRIGVDPFHENPLELYPAWYP